MKLKTRKSHPDCEVCLAAKQRHRKRYLETKDTWNARSRKYYSEHKQQIKERIFTKQAMNTL